MFIEQAFAQGAGGAGQAPGLLVQLLPFILIFVVFYFLLIRPQQKKMKEHQQMLQAIRRGDQVVTGGGIVGNVTKVINDDELQVEIADGVRVRVMRSTVSNVLSKPQPVSDERKGGKGAKNAKNKGEKAESAEPVDDASGDKDSEQPDKD